MTAALIAVVAYLLFIKLHSSPMPSRTDDSVGVHHKVESKLELNATQTAEMPTLAGSILRVFRFQDSSGIWQVVVGGGAPVGLKAEPMGLLHTVPIAGEVETPVYLCEYAVAKDSTHRSRSLDINRDCESGGKPFGQKPAGYVSKLIRTGYLFAVRCATPKAGMYVSLNARCEDPTHRFSGFLGAVLAENISAVPASSN